MSNVIQGQAYSKVCFLAGRREEEFPTVERGWIQINAVFVFLAAEDAGNGRWPFDSFDTPGNSGKLVIQRKK
jgi:hypothetical protein